MRDADSIATLIFGRPDIEAVPLREPILLHTFIVVAVMGVALLVALTSLRLRGAALAGMLHQHRHHKATGVVRMASEGKRRYFPAAMPALRNELGASTPASSSTPTESLSTSSPPSHAVTSAMAAPMKAQTIWPNPGA